MKNKIKVFSKKEFGEIRTIMIDDEPWFVGKDIAQCLGYKNTRDALIKHVDEDDKITVAIHDGNRGNPNQIVINESGLYSLILRSDLPDAKKFKKWVTKEVLPSIRKQGYYDLFDREKIREEGKRERTILTDSIKESNENERMHGFAYSRYTDLAYTTAFGKNSKQLRVEKGLNKKESLRDYLTAEELKELKKAENLISGFVSYGKLYNEVKDEIQRLTMPKLN